MNANPGFSESGELDTAIGTVRGYRRWSLISEPKNARRDRTSIFNRNYYLMGATGAYWLPRGEQKRQLHYEVCQEPSGSFTAICKNVVSPRAVNHPDNEGHVPPAERIIMSYPYKADGKTRSRTVKCGCGCGFWAYWTLTLAVLNKFTGNNYSKVYVRPVAGVVEGFGKTLLGTKGFRCQKLKILALCTQELTDAPHFKLPEFPGTQYFSSLDEMEEAFPPESVYRWQDNG